MTDMTQVLVVDDDPLVLSGFKEILARAGYSVSACSSGQAALALLAEKRFSVVLTDLFMPRVSGMDVLNAALGADPDCVVVVVTGFASVRGAVDALRRGAADYIIKPCEDDELLHRIRLGLERAELRADLRSKELDTEKMKAIAQTAVTVNDQINTPLNVILNSAEYIRLKRLPETVDVKQSLDFIVQEVAKIKSVIQKLATAASPSRTREYSVGHHRMIDIDPPRVAALPTDHHHARKQRILVVDDEQFMVHTLTKLLEVLGYDVVTAFGGREASEKFAAEQIDLVVSDVHMPDMNGLELMASIKSQNPDFPVILVTGYGVEDARKTAGEYHADGFLGKPFRIEELRQMIERALHSSAAA
ncbi:MAG: response regulator [Calditrichaeota bacterium]|nr:response regulator [Calditrichota bacterium]MCB9366768.1 response regulator [Calditrichota bacterium]MCB9391921.1 response regulator [Calditrichota bacterium]